MAMIEGRSPAAEPASTRVRVAIKLAERALRDAKADTSTSALSELHRVVPGVEFRPYFAEEEDLRAAAVAPFNRYVAAEAPDREAAAALVRKLQDLDLIEEAYVEGGPVPPPVYADDDPKAAYQGYLSAAPTGIDARWAWSMTDGAGIKFVDLERGWTLDHEDLAAAGITVMSGVNQDYHGHGTAVLGEVVAVDNTNIGGVGIAPGATCRVVSQWRTASTYNTATAILSAAQGMSAGDVLLLEAQTDFNGLENCRSKWKRRCSTPFGTSLMRASWSSRRQAMAVMTLTASWMPRIAMCSIAPAPTFAILARSWSGRRIRRSLTHVSASPAMAAGSTVTPGVRTSLRRATAGKAPRRPPIRRDSAVPRARPQSWLGRLCCCSPGARNDGQSL